MTTRKSARIASRTSTTQEGTSTPQKHDASDNMNVDSASAQEVTDEADDSRPAKRRKVQRKPSTKTTNPQPHHQQIHPLFANPSPSSPPLPGIPPFPSRAHRISYHHPALLTSQSTRHALLTWFTTTASPLRPMPWRKPFHAPGTLSRAQLAQRAYEVWISEVMLQQTRVQVVVGYWTRWMARWLTIQELARATEAEVMSVWQGLGYYSRGRRVLEAARGVCAADEEGVLPGDVEGLMRVPGVGRYTAGAVAAIVFGVAAPMVDGNVLRVLSRQMGVLGDVKGDRAVVALLWEAAGELVKAVAADGEEADGVSDRPGQWGQALMELGSTVCTPKPNCAACPITATCRTYAEGVALAENRQSIGAMEDIEDLCTFCAPFEQAIEDEGKKAENESEARPSNGDGRLSRFFATTQAAKPTANEGLDARTLATVVNHARKFPLKKPKKKVREEETLVCAIRRSDGRYFIHQRPEKGLLAGLWELPSHTLPASNDSTAKTRKAKAMAYVAGLVAVPKAKERRSLSRPPKHVGELGSVPWLFSHLKLTMHVHLFEVNDAGGLPELGERERWASVDDIDAESMGTGMKKCWSLVKEGLV